MHMLNYFVGLLWTFLAFWSRFVIVIDENIITTSMFMGSVIKIREAKYSIIYHNLVETTFITFI